jgi:integrase
LKPKKVGTPVVVKSHLLRHAFATEAVQRQKMPIDIVAKILHQRDLNVTSYYSAPTPSQVAQAVSDLHDVISDIFKNVKPHSSYEKCGLFQKSCVLD